MWLLDVSTLQLTLFMGHQALQRLRYAILSHTWEGDEVSFQDIQNLDFARTKGGFRKIQLTCEQARQDGLKYAWVDICCIDKKSSAELQEAINSMFQWYAQAYRCYAYLSDVRGGDMTESRWFTRGW